MRVFEEIERPEDVTPNDNPAMPRLSTLDGLQDFRFGLADNLGIKS